ncbi:MAG TPA: SIMPL domain-containing protein [bacterium]|nr:SIMPL domain-containing protein [bacterium]
MRSFARTTTVLGIVGVVALLAATPPVSQAQGAPVMGGGGARVIVVTGEGSVDATPDQATVTVGVQTVRRTAQDAQNANNAAMTQVIHQVTALGIPKDRIRTSGVELAPQRAPGPGTGPITGYAATNRVTVTVDDLGLTGRVIDAAVGAGANEVEGLSFGLRDASSERTRALQLAVQNAQAMATTLATAAGVGPIHLVRIEQVGQTVAPRFAAAEVSTPVLPGTVSVAASVRAVYAF